jgi:hypothetical protein
MDVMVRPAEAEIKCKLHDNVRTLTPRPQLLHYSIQENQLARVLNLTIRIASRGSSEYIFRKVLIDAVWT